MATNKYSPENAFINPQINRFNHYVKHQEELKPMKMKIQKFVMQDKYRIGRNQDCHAMRWDTVRAKRDMLEIPEFQALYSRLRDLVTADYAVKHEFRGRGVELSPGQRPMDKKNVLVTVASGGIANAVKEVIEQDSILVSKDVYGQLNKEQREECAVVDGIHQYATGEVGKPTLSNPTGYWIIGSGEFGCTVDLQPGVRQTYTIASVTLTFNLALTFIPPVDFDVGTIMKEVYGLSNGRYQVSTGGVRKTGVCVGAGEDEKAIRKKLEGFVLRDKRGWHGSDPTMYGPCSRKIDGIFCYLKAKKGRAELQFRNGEKWIGESTHDIECAFELVGDILYLLYVDVYKNNDVHTSKVLQDYFRDQVEFVVNLGRGSKNLGRGSKTRSADPQQVNKGVSSDLNGKTLTSTKVADNLPHDGLVIWGQLRQNFFKEINTVDITKAMAATLMKEDDVVIDHYDNMEDGNIYEFAVDDPRHLTFIKIRDTRSKVMPNMFSSVRRTLEDPTLMAVRAHHNACLPGSDCEVCKFL